MAHDPVLSSLTRFLQDGRFSVGPEPGSGGLRPAGRAAAVRGAAAAGAEQEAAGSGFTLRPDAGPGAGLPDRDWRSETCFLRNMQRFWSSAPLPLSVSSSAGFLQQLEVLLEDEDPSVRSGTCELLHLLTAHSLGR